MNIRALYYEVHISILQEDIDKIRQVLKKFCPHCKVSTIIGDEPDTIVTSRHKTMNLAVKSMVQTLGVLHSYNALAKRHKIEIAVTDSDYVETTGGGE